jgi:Na+-translocating ferredoxin:NAD+ oxidoreductase RnfG subunit
MTRNIAVVALLLAASTMVWAHLSSPVVLVPERDAVASQHLGAKKLSLREASLTADERKAVQSAHGWRATEDVHNFYMGRDDAGKLLSASVFMTEATMHGIIKVAVGFTPDGNVKAAEVVEVSEEIYAHMKGMMDRGFTKRFAGRGCLER